MSKSKIKKVLVYADFGCTTGFGNVAKEIISRLAAKRPDLQFIVFATNNHMPAAYDYSKNIHVIPGHTCQPLFQQDSFSRLGLCDFMDKNDFGLFIMIHDIEMADFLLPHLNMIRKYKKDKNRPSFKSIIYFPVDSPPHKKNCEGLKFFDARITYTEYGKDVITDLMGPEFGKTLKIINHGVNTDVFRYLSNSDRYERRLQIAAPGKFIIGTVNRNSVRKDVPTLLMAFAQLLKRAEKIELLKDNIVLYLHMNPLDSVGHNLYNICSRLGLKIGENVIFPKDHSENTGCSEEELNLVYNSFDLFVTTTTAEGWGLTVTEAMAAGIPVMCPMHTSLTEITDGGTRCIPIHDTDEVIFQGEVEKIRHKTNVEKLAAQMEWFVSLKMYKPAEFENLWFEKYTACQDYINTLSWDKVAQKFLLNINPFI